MRPLLFLAFAAVVLPGACKRVEPQTPASGTPDAILDDAALPTLKPQPPTGWIEADGPGEVALEWRTVENQPGFMISCNTEGVLRISLPDPAGSTPNAAPARLVIGLLETPVEVLSGEVIGPHLDAETPVTAELLAALQTASAVRLQLDGASAQTGDDEEGRLAGLAQGCAALAGLAPPA